MPSSPAPSLQIATVTRICEFLVIAIHAILHQHNVYPARLFAQHRAYGLSTKFCKAPLVIDYITRTVTAIRPWLISSAVQSIAIVILPTTSPAPPPPLARYVFDLQLLAPPAAPPHAPALAALDTQLRAQLASILAPPPHARDGGMEKTWDVVVRTTGVRVAQEWVPADGRERGEFDFPEVVPLKDADAHGDTVQISSRLEFPMREPA